MCVPSVLSVQLLDLFLSSGLQDRSPASQRTYATAPHAKARRVKRTAYCIFDLVNSFIRVSESEGKLIFFSLSEDCKEARLIDI